jgi:hypothetical protein
MVGGLMILGYRELSVLALIAVSISALDGAFGVISPAALVLAFVLAKDLVDRPRRKRQRATCP